MKIKFGKKVMPVFLSFLLLIGLMPTVVFAAEMEDGVANLTVNSSKVAFAGHEWWVIGDGTSGVYPQENHITLLAANNRFGTIAFRTGNYSSFDNSTQYSGDGWYYANNPEKMKSWETPNEYAGSTLQKEMVEIANSFPTKEQEVITARDLASGADSDNNWSSGKSDYIDGIAGQGISNQKLWALSEDEWITIGNNEVLSYGGWWWLRSPYSINGGDGARQGNPSGDSMFSDIVDYGYDAVRPALSLNLGSVLFTSSAASGGKSSATVETGLLETSTPSTPSGTVKFTMKDDSQTLTLNATTEQSTQSGSTLYFSYANATTGENQYVSCVLADSDSGDVKYYGKLANSSSSNAASGNLSVPLTDVEDGTYILKIFSEEANGDLYTDFCSEPVTMTVTVESGSGTVSNFTGNVLHEHKWNEPVWNWTDDYSSATATFICGNDASHTETVDAVITSETTDATATADGKTVYTATVKWDGNSYRDTKIVIIPATETTPPDTSTSDDQTGDKDNPGTGATDSPQTGDNSNIAFWISLMGVGAAGLGATLILQKRRRMKG